MVGNTSNMYICDEITDRGLIKQEGKEKHTLKFFDYTLFHLFWEIQKNQVYTC